MGECKCGFTPCSPCPPWFIRASVFLAADLNQYLTGPRKFPLTMHIKLTAASLRVARFAPAVQPVHQQIRQLPRQLALDKQTMNVRAKCRHHADGPGASS